MNQMHAQYMSTACWCSAVHLRTSNLACNHTHLCSPDHRHRQQAKNPLVKVGLKDVECGLCEYVVNYVKQEVDDPIAQEQIKNSAIAVRASASRRCDGATVPN